MNPALDRAVGDSVKVANGQFDSLVIITKPYLLIY